MLEILNNSGARNNVADFKIPYILKRDFSQHFKLGLMRKDLKLAENEMKKLNLELPLAMHILEVYDKADKKGLSEEDFLATVKVLEEMSDTKIESKLL